MENIELHNISDGDCFQFAKTGVLSLILGAGGNAQLILDKKEFPLNEDSLFMILPDMEIVIRTEKNAQVKVINFSAETLQVQGKEFSIDVFGLFVTHTKDANQNSTEAVKTQIRNLIQMMFDEKADEQCSFQILWSYLKIILLMLLRAHKSQRSLPAKNVERLHDFFTLVHHNARTEKQVSFYAGQLNISTKRLNQILQSLMNKNASFFIQEHLILEAKRELIRGDLTVNEIAYELGFEDRAYFSRFFKRWVGIPPNQYKLAYFEKRDEKLFKDGLDHLSIKN